MSNINVPNVTLADGKRIPQLGLGTFLLRGETCERIVAEALSVGYRHIDTATVYENEEEIGRAIESSGIARDELFVTTKLANSDQTDARGGFERSLDRLGLDYVDLYLLHWPLPRRGTALAAWRELARIRESKRAVSIGVCNFEIEHLTQLIDETGVVPVVNQIELHPEHQRTELVAFCREQNIAVESWGPLAQAKSTLLKKRVVEEAARAHSKTPGQIVLRWHVQRHNIVIPKTQTSARLLENLSIFDFELSENEMEAISSLESGRNYGPDPRSYDG